VSSYLKGGLRLYASDPKTAGDAYKGYRIALSAKGMPRHSGGHELEGSYKASFAAAPKQGLQQIFLPFDTFSSDWFDFTGECTTKDPNGYQHKCCAESAGHKGSPAVCPMAKTLGVVDGTPSATAAATPEVSSSRRGRR